MIWKITIGTWGGGDVQAPEHPPKSYVRENNQLKKYIFDFTKSQFISFITQRVNEIIFTFDYFFQLHDIFIFKLSDDFFFLIFNERIIKTRAIKTTSQSWACYKIRRSIISAKPIEFPNLTLISAYWEKRLGETDLAPGPPSS